LVILAPLVTLFCVGIASGQDVGEAALKRYFEGKQVTVKLDMPATKGGVDLYPDDEKKTFDYNKHLNKLKDNGVSIPQGGTTTITKIELSRKTIEVQLDGGGFGSSEDLRRVGPEPTSPQALPKTQRELDLEAQLKTETDRRKLDHLRDELRYERDRREDADRRARREYENAVNERNDRIAYERPRSGSRFNVVLKKKKINTVTPDELMRYLEKYVDFSAPGN
jgi:hypothetical protein